MNTPELATIADIIPPTPPVASGFSVTVYLLVIVIMIIGTYGIYRYLRSSTSQLRQLRRQYRNGITDKRELAFRLSQLICQYHHLPRLSPYYPPAQSTTQNWHRFASTLQSACFSRHGLDDDSLNRVLNEAGTWLHNGHD